MHLWSIYKQAYRGQKLEQQMMEEALRYITEELYETAVKIQAQHYLRDFYLRILLYN